MGLTIVDRLKHGWNAFKDDKNINYNNSSIGPGYGPTRPDRIRSYISNERSIIASLINRIAVDAAAIDIRHVKVDENGQYVSDVDSYFNDCLNIQANIDQSGRDFRQDMYESLLDEGCIAIVPVSTDLNPRYTTGYDITELRIGKVVQWYPKNVLVNLYNEDTALREDILLPKSMVAIVENPFYTVMNGPNSSLKRLKRKIDLLDRLDEKNNSSKLDLIIQLPYSVRTEARKKEAEKRKKEIEFQLIDSKYGIAYTDGTEKITQLNRSVENNYLEQINELTTQVFSQMGMTQEILNGTASEETMTNYFSRIIEPIVSACCEAMYSKFLSRTAKTKKEQVKFFRDPFKLTPVTNLADVADRLTRNEILSSNEFRAIIGFKPSSDPRANELRNKNIAANSEYPGDEYETDEIMDESNLYETYDQGG